jgi:hypothetical protein
MSSNLHNGAGNSGSVITRHKVDLIGLHGALLGPPGRQGLGLVPHTVLAADHGEGSYVVNGTITITAPAATEAGRFTGTITFTIG